MNASSDRARRVARQHLETSRLMGVDFVPVRVDLDDAPDESESTAQATAEVPASDAASLDRKRALLEDLRQRHDAECPHCTTASGHTRTVFGEGHPDARVMFVGEAPGAEEDRTGRPFVGRAGRKLDQMIEAMGLKRTDVYIANVLKSRPPGNRTPLQPEIDGCSPYLTEQIRIIEPEVIVTLGGPATKLLLRTDAGITRLRGQWASFAEEGIEVPVMPTFHPAYLLRNYTRETRERVWSDLQAVMQQLDLA